MFKTRQKFGDSFLTIVHLLVSENTVRKIVKFDQIEHFGLSKKAAVVSNFCLIGKIHHNFLVPKMIELGRKTFMPIQTLDLHRVLPFYKNEPEKNRHFLILSSMFTRN